MLYDNWECLEDNPFVAIKSARHLFETLLEPDFGTQISLYNEGKTYNPIFDSENPITEKLRYKFAEEIYEEFISLISQIKKIKQKLVKKN